MGGGGYPLCKGIINFRKKLILFLHGEATPPSPPVLIQGHCQFQKKIDNVF
uniref:Uncharacterized protein n=1 Tax=viral metagenome TaxID=1070528 RepID=A0A6C0KVF1_9ZZZZ